nr:uncharacterized protein CTRU02_13038 [Colletotrichum truncatum]KAF6783788.1 hypothetical protein CTRU02_13038 [Colletotrichum truncatum]
MTQGTESEGDCRSILNDEQSLGCKKGLGRVHMAGYGDLGPEE